MIDEIYSDRILRLAANMPRAGRLPAPQGTGEQTAKLCGSRAVVDVTLDDQDRIAGFAQEVKACALGQAAAAVLGEMVIGASVKELVDARDALMAMLKHGAPPPAGRFAGLAVLECVRDYPARHASTLVAFDAAVAAVRQAQSTRTSLAGAA
ncbi:iron-sulfur cluster assembly scaffold protein [Brevundimonas sp. 2R-24]|uniref:Iron-sulfur cluster assembly scaffold protein n=1 Tax=Peiella sedimenti TaxID=3061083 RepID=A0ABT8SJP2_9CAUL|nr:iron-sulfur cluster assembly scaffold protein [Caulobacteraceae bacterium XZ-24]